jgi:hypothetical protein
VVAQLIETLDRMGMQAMQKGQRLYVLSLFFFFFFCWDLW